jgi:hypothetical protein
VRNLKQKIQLIAKITLKRTLETALFLVKIMIPVSLAVELLGFSGLLQKIALLIAPLMKILGLPGEAALVYLSGALLNNYSAIAVMSSMNLTLHDATILAFMCLVSHNLIMETSVMKSIGSSAIKMLLLRIGTALIGGMLLNLLLPASFESIKLFASKSVAQNTFWPTILAWALSTLKLVGRIIFYIFVLMLTQTIMEEFNFIDKFSRWFGWLMKLFGLEQSMSFLWIVANVIGYSYGAGVIKAARDDGRMTREEGDLFNHHAAIMHSLFEDTLLFLAISVPLFWLIVPRLVFALVVVWSKRARHVFLKRRWKAGIA